MCQINLLHYLDENRWTEVIEKLYVIVTELCEEYMQVIYSCIHSLKSHTHSVKHTA